MLIYYIQTCRHAQYSLGDFAASVSAFERGLALEPSNANLKAGLENAKTRLTAESRSQERSPAATSSAPAADTPRGAAPNFNDLLGSLGGLGGGGAGGGMPDLSTLMSNPAVMQMASQLASNGGLASLMQDPNIANMVSHWIP